MATVNEFVTTAQHQIGYKESGTNITKYSQDFDTTYWQFFNTKKQGAEWCSIFVHWCAVKTIGKDKTLKFFGETPKTNAAAGVGYFWDYLKAKGYKSSAANAKMGDIIFFKNSKGISHVGIVEKVDAKNIISIEGNKSNSVKRCTHSKTASTIYGVMSPTWSQFDTTSGPQTKPVNSMNKIIDDIAHDVILGKYGTYPDRKHRINSLGYGNIYTQVQKRVNLMLYGR